MIKARPVRRRPRRRRRTSSSELAPYIWRKHLDFAAIQDIHSIKRQIHAHQGGSARSRSPGHNIKLGRGGIREIEFFAQTQQLIFGGRDPELRQPRDLRALRALAAAGRVDAARRRRADRGLPLPAHASSTACRWSTTGRPRRLPDDEADAARRSPRFLRPCRRRGLRRAYLLAELRRVEGHYAGLFEEAPTCRPGRQPGVHRHRRRSRHAARPWPRMGFTRPAARSRRMVRALASRPLPRHAQPARARAADRADARRCCRRSARPPRPTRRCCTSTASSATLPAGMQLFSLFHANPALLELVADDHGRRAAPRRASGAPHPAARCGAVAGLLPAAAAGRGAARRPRASAVAGVAHFAGHGSTPGAPLGQRPRSSRSACSCCAGDRRPAQAGLA